MTVWRGVLTAAVLFIATCAAGCANAESAPVKITHTGQAAVMVTARHLVNTLESSGQAVLHPTDTTSADCGSVGCAQAITTDRFRLLSFGTTGAAQKYGADRGLKQVENVVISFAPPVPPAERESIWTAIVKAVR